MKYTELPQSKVTESKENKSKPIKLEQSKAIRKKIM